MPVFQFGEFLPDIAPLVNPGVVDVRNVLPSPHGYTPFKGLSAATEALVANPLAAINATSTSNVSFQYVATAEKIFQNVDNLWVDRTRLLPGDYVDAGEDSSWEFVPWKNKLIATNFEDDPQVISFGDANFDALTTELKARHVAVVYEFVVFGDTFDAVDGDVPYRVRWSAFGDETSYTVDPTTLSDFQDLKVSRVQRIIGGEYGVVFQTDRIWRMTWVGAPQAFQFDEVIVGIGLITPRAAVRVGDVIYFWARQGFYALESGTRPIPIGAGRLDNFVETDLDQSYVNRISAARDPASQRVFFLYPGQGSSLGKPNRLVVIDPVLNKWAIIDQDALLLWVSAGTGITLDAVASEGDPDNLDAEPGAEVSFDDPRWVGALSALAAFDYNRRSGFFDGANRSAYITTKEYVFSEGARTRLNGVRGLIDGGHTMMQIGRRNSLADPVVFGSTHNSRSEGRFAIRSNARYHTFKFLLNGDWRHAIGFEIDQGDLIRAERRG